jgi:hypothetical protein
MNDDEKAAYDQLRRDAGATHAQQEPAHFADAGRQVFYDCVCQVIADINGDVMLWDRLALKGRGHVLMGQDDAKLRELCDGIWNQSQDAQSSP